MEISKKFLKNNKTEHLLYVLLLASFVLLDVPVPPMLAKQIDTTFGNILVIIFALSILVHQNIVVGLVSLVAAYEVIRRSGKNSVLVSLNKNEESERTKYKKMKALNKKKTQLSLEENIINRNNPIPKKNVPEQKFTSLLGDTHNALRL